MTDCIFCKIIQGEIPSAKVYEDDYVYAFLDITQTTPGHTLVIPKKHIDDLFGYEADLAGQVFKRIPMIGRAIMQAFPEAKGLNLLNNNGEAAYQSVFHSHFHLIPRYDRDNDDFGLIFKNNGDQYSQEDFQALAQKIQEHTQALND